MNEVHYEPEMICIQNTVIVDLLNKRRLREDLGGCELSPVYFNANACSKPLGYRFDSLALFVYLRPRENKAS